MSYQVLARKWRPKTFREMVGQGHVLRALVNALDEQRLHHAYLFTGTRGVGKTTVARIFAKALNCEQGISAEPCGQCDACREIDEGRFIDLIEVDAASRTKVEDTRELLDNVQYAPTRGRFKIYLIDEVHMLSTHSFNALLKTLEEPPPHVKFLLATTDPQKLPPTILSRCLQFSLKAMPQPTIVDHLSRILEAEAIEFEPAGLRLIARAAEGSMRDALSLLDQGIAYGEGRVSEALISEMLGLIGQDALLRILQAVRDQDAAAAMASVEGIAETTQDFGGVLSELLSVIHRLAITQALGEDEGCEPDWLELSRAMPPEEIQLLYQIGLMGRRDLELAPDPQSGFEMLVLRMLAFRPKGSEKQPARPVPAGEPVPRPAAPKPAPPAASPAPAEQSRNHLDQIRAALGTGGGKKKPVEPPAPTAPVKAAEPENALPDWLELVERLSLKGMTRQLAMHCQLKGKQGGVVRLAISGGHKSLCTKTTESQLVGALSDYFREKVRLEFVAADVDAVTPAAVHAQVRQEQQQAAREAIENDPNVQFLRREFDAEIIPESVRPMGEGG